MEFSSIMNNVEKNVLLAFSEGLSEQVFNTFGHHWFKFIENCKLWL